MNKSVDLMYSTMAIINNAVFYIGNLLSFLQVFLPHTKMDEVDMLDCINHFTMFIYI
jgi:hypothetical protein